MPEVTDLMRVAQYAKSSGAPSDVYNAACRLLDQRDERRRAEIARVEALAERWGRGLWAERYAARELRAALHGPHSPADARSPVPAAMETSGGAREAQGAGE
jgi:hypothetical protein